MPTPKLSRKLNRSCKLTDNDIKSIQDLYSSNNWNISNLAERFNVVESTIRYWIDEEFRQDCINRSAHNTKKRWRDDEEFRKHNRKKHKEYVQYRLSLKDPEFVKFYYSTRIKETNDRYKKNYHLTDHKNQKMGLIL